LKKDGSSSENRSEGTFSEIRRRSDRRSGSGARHERVEQTVDPKVFVTVAAYNEGQMIASTVHSLLKMGYAPVVVDDGSTDDTWDQVTALPVYALRHPINLGQGAALQTGMTFALGHGAEFVVHFDADGQHRVEDIPRLLEPLYAGEADIVLGSRFLRPEDRRRVPIARRVILRGGVLVNGLLTRIWLSDAHNGLRAMNRRSALAITLNQTGFAHATEILEQIRRYRLRYVERPTAVRYSSYSLKKGQRFSNAFGIVIDLMLGKAFR
jgi:polyprenyl-phospho-N-acetylgalactosaminyl synthase